MKDLSNHHYNMNKQDLPQDQLYEYVDTAFPV